MRTPEAAVKDKIKAYLNSIGAYSYWPVGMGMGARTVDCLACYKGRFLAIEVKRPEGGKLTNAQRWTLEKVAGANGRWCVATSVEDVKALVRDICA